MQLSWERNPSTLEKMRHVPLEDGHLPLEDGHVPLEDGHVPLEDGHVPLEDGHVPLEDGHVPLEDGHVPLEDGHVPLEDGHVPLEDGHTCIPLVVEVFGGWGNEAIICCLNCQKRWPPSEVTSTIYSRLSLILMGQNARAILARCVSPTTSCDFY